MNKITNLFFQCFTTVLIVLVSIITSTKLILNTNFLYYYDVTNLNISKTSNLSIEEIKLNYSYLVDYINSSVITEFNPPSLKFSNVSKIHFKEVQQLLNVLDTTLVISIILIFLFAFILYKYKSFKFIKWSAFSLIFIPLSLAICFLFDFDSYFNSFHQLFFNNDTWLLDPSIDEAIKILPEQYFMHCSMLILFLCFCFGSALLVFFYHIKKQTIKKQAIF